MKERKESIQIPQRKNNSNNIHRTIIGLLVLIILILGYTQFDRLKTSGEVISPDASPDTSLITQEYFFSVTAGGGAVIETKGNTECFKFTLRDANHVVWFTDRPMREAWTTSADTLAAGWSEQFSDSPPNADLQLFKEDGTWVTTVVTLKTSPIWDEEAQTLIFNDACTIVINDDGSTIDGSSRILTDDTFSTAVLFVDGATLFKWNSCYSASGTTGDKAGRCVEQWGSYPLACSTGLSSYHKASGKKCSSVCNKGNSDCPNGCYSNYQSGDSWNYYVSSYKCS